MIDLSESIPLTHALNNAGRFVHVDEVANGDACGCACPECRQPLSAVQGDIRIHHFRHKGENKCKWALDIVLQQLAGKVLAEQGEMVLPALNVFDHVEKCERQVTPPWRFPVAVIDKLEVCGRKAPALAVEVDCGKAGKKSLALIVWAAHKPEESQISELASAGFNVISISLARLYEWKKSREGRHAERKELLAEIQTEECMREALNGRYKFIASWEHNDRLEREERTSLETLHQLEQEETERKKEERQRLEEMAAQERRAAQERVRAREAISRGECPACGLPLIEQPAKGDGFRRYKCSGAGCGQSWEGLCKHDWERVTEERNCPAQKVTLYAPEDLSAARYWGCVVEHDSKWECLDDLFESWCRGCDKLSRGKCQGIEAIGENLRKMNGLKKTQVTIGEACTKTVFTGKLRCKICGVSSEL